jgi:Zn-dependent protease with chaperone function
MIKQVGGNSSQARRFLTVFLILLIIGLGFFYDQYIHTPSLAQQFNPAERVEHVAHKLTVESKLVRQASPFTLRVLEAAEVPAAFIMPSGKIYITRGLLDYLETEQQVAAVLAHEMAHSIAGHFEEPQFFSIHPGLYLQLDLGKR